MPVPLKRYFVKFLLFLLEFLKAFGRVGLIVLQALAAPFLFFWKVALRRLVFLIYGLALRAKISATRVLPPMRRTFFAIFGHRYVVHAMVAIMATFVATSNLYARDADLGQSSTQALMYDLLRVPDEFTADESADVNAESLLNAPLEGSATLSPLIPPADFASPLAYDQSGVASPFVPIDEASEEDDRIVIAKPSVHVVQQGDTVSAVAKKYGISVNTILWANDLTARSVLKLGQELTVLPVSGVLHEVKRGETLGAIAKKYGTDVDKILAANLVKSPTAVQIGQRLVIPDGRPPVSAAPAPKAKASTPTPPRLGDVRDVFRPPEEAPPSRTVDGVEIVWPTNQKRINQYYKWKHTGIDINGTLSDATYAVDDGIVTFAGWNKSGYGNMILIDHGNGMVTRYAHHSKLYVKVGDQVKKGQTIGMVGSTGRSTGPHLHFEIYMNGKRVNPLEYYR
ncbi:MAG TPA: M23 family metallopeptidase [Candidatus Baltobacteraceae bacterium]|nr:M23 family metallopeptidase [Candidatus Baltobacteraceae bacterium]